MGRASHEPEQASEQGAGAAVASPLSPAMPLGSLAWASAVGNRAVQRFARGRTLARLTPQEVLEQYQVEEDTVAEWSPKLGGLIPIPLAGSKVLTTTEGKLLDSLTFSRGLLGLSTFKDIAEDAFARSTSEFPDPSAIPSYVPKDRDREWKNNDGHRDAFRHCYWNARLTKEFGAAWTRQFTTAHEALPENTAAREAMDLFNNEVDHDQPAAVDRLPRAGAIAVPAGDASAKQ